MMAMAPQDAGLLMLADMPDLPRGAALAEAFDRLGLIHPHYKPVPDMLQLRFGGTAIAVSLAASQSEEEAHQQQALGDHAMGDAAVAAAVDGPALRMWVAQPDADRGRHLQQVQHLCAAAAMIGAALGAGRLHWQPAQLWSPMAALVDAVAASEAQGLPPIMHLVAFMPADGADVQTRGLAHFGLPELRLNAEPPLPFVEAVRRLARLAVHALLVGPMSAGAQVPGLVPDEVISIGRTTLHDAQPVIPITVRRQP